MFARKLEFDIKLEKKEELIRKIREDVLPIMKKQNGFFDMMMLFQEMKQEKFLVISFWEDKIHADRYEKEVFPKINDMMKPYLITPIVMTPHNVETRVSQRVIAVAA
jgi:quinol monooxygenase YgiN